MTVYEVHVSLKYADAAEISLPSLYAGASEMPVKARAQVALASVSDGAKGDPGPKGSDGQMLVATSATAAATAAKVATLRSGTLSLKAGASVTVVFSEANTAASPTLNVGGTGAKAIRTNGTPYAYWVAGTAVSFVYDGTYWQVCSVPVYASTVTVGNPGGANVRIDSNSVDVRDGDRVLSSFGASLVKIGTKAASVLLASILHIEAMQTHPATAGGSQQTIDTGRISVPVHAESGTPWSAIELAGRNDVSGEVTTGLRVEFSVSDKDGSVLPTTFVDGGMTVSGTIGLADKESALATRRGLRISQGSKVCHGHGTPWVTLFESWSEFQQATGCYDSGTPTLVTMNGDWGAFDGALSGCEICGGKAVYVMAQTTSGLPNISSTQSLRINWICIW